MNNFFEVITTSDIVFAFAAALIITSIINRFRGGFKFIGVYGDIKINYSGKNLSSVTKSCYELFPKDMITFKGNTFKRGSHVQILTSNNHKITGQLIGANSDNMICLITAKHIIAHELSHILAITAVDSLQASDLNDNNDGN